MENIVLFFGSFVRGLNYHTLNTHIHTADRDVRVGPPELSVMFTKFPKITFFHLPIAGEVVWLIKAYNDVTIATM